MNFYQIFDHEHLTETADIERETSCMLNVHTGYILDLIVTRCLPFRTLWWKAKERVTASSSINADGPGCNRAKAQINALATTNMHCCWGESMDTTLG
jgi:hypothetical protein